MKKNYISSLVIIIISLSLGACNLPGRATPTSQVDLLNTAAAQTIQAQQTNIAQTSEAASKVTPTATLDLDSGITETSAPPATPSPTGTATQKVETVCDQAGFISETIPDGTKFAPGQAFTKTWTLKNTGTCTWNSSYAVVFVSGVAMNAPASKQLTSGTVAPGGTVQIKLDLQAPNSAGTHRGEFKLRNANGVLYGIGAKNSPFWVEIDISGTLYDFVSNYCASGVTWTSGAGALPCPGAAGDAAGSVRKDNEPTLENGVKENEPGLVTHPEWVNDGWIRGTFPQITVTDDVFFKTVLGCNGSAACDVKFKLNYKVDGGTEKTLATWHEVKDNGITKVKLDLSSLAGQKVQFILLVETNGSSSNDEALWLAPRIEP